MTSQHQDPLDSLLEQAFAAGLSHDTNRNLIEQISHHIARQQMIRNLVLTTTGVIATIATLFLALPAIDVLAGMLIALDLPVWLTPGNALSLGAILILAPWLYAAVDDPV